MRDFVVPHWSLIHTIVFDFDGVFTDNKIWIDQNGKESVRCDRRDGLAFDFLRRFSSINDWKIDYFVLSKETNSVVEARCKKLNIRCLHGISNKAEYLRGYLEVKGRGADGMIYIGNDLNDLLAMQLSGCSLAPSDAHPVILQQASMVLQQKGGDGFLRACIEMLLRIDMMGPDELDRLLRDL